MNEVAPSPKIERYLVERAAGSMAISDDELADLIREESLSSPVDSDSASLDRYLRLVPDLEKRLVALDAAIDVVLRQRSHGGCPDARVVEELSGHYPHLAEHIREAAALSAGLLTSRSSETVNPARGHSLPCDFGPVMESGVRRYRLLKELGRGAHGQVYLAEDRLLADQSHRPLVAIKLLGGGHRGERARQRLTDEAAKARRIDHPNVVRVFDRGVSGEGEDFIVYEYVSGGTLDRALPERAAKGRSRQVARLIASVARGVHAAHHAGLVHCDLKPGNVLITEDGSPKVADFGVAARVVDPDDAVIRGTEGGPLGNLAFIAPEQFREEPGSVAIPADLYALGGLLYFALTGSLPNGRTAQEIGTRHRQVDPPAQPPDVRQSVPELDADVAAIVSKALAPNPSDRFASASELADDLERWAELRPVTSRRAGPARRMSLWARRRPMHATLLAACCTLMIGAFVAIGVWYQQRNFYKWYEQQIVKANQMNERVSFGANLLPTLWIMEQISAVSILGREQFDDYMYSQRFSLLSMEIERAKAEGRADDIMTLIWEATLGHWMLNDSKEHPEARSLLAASAERWKAKLGPDDAMVKYVTMLHASSVIREIWSQQENVATQRPLDADVREQAAAAAEEVEQFLADMPSHERYGPAHILAVRILRIAYSGRLLANRERLLEMDRLYEEIKQGHLVPRPVQTNDSSTN